MGQKPVAEIQFADYGQGLWRLGSLAGGGDVGPPIQFENERGPAGPTGLPYTLHLQ